MLLMMMTTKMTTMMTSKKKNKLFVRLSGFLYAEFFKPSVLRPVFQILSKSLDKALLTLQPQKQSLYYSLTLPLVKTGLKKAYISTSLYDIYFHLKLFLLKRLNKNLFTYIISQKIHIMSSSLLLHAACMRPSHWLYHIAVATGTKKNKTFLVKDK